MDSFLDWIERIVEVWEGIVAYAIVGILFVTAPLWILPFLIFRSFKKRGGAK